MHRIIVGLLCLVFAAAHAAGPQDVERRIVLSTLVNGSIDVDSRTGKVTGYVLDKPDLLPVAVIELAAKQIPQWKFDPAPSPDGPAVVRSLMSVRFIAKPVDANNFAVRISGASFYLGDADDYPKGKVLKAPKFPAGAGMRGAAGTVYLLVKIERDGRVGDVAAEQTNLRVISDDEGMAIWRGMFEKMALKAARVWEFDVPAKAPPAGAPYWVIRVPVEFVKYRGTPWSYGQWEAYVPGPRYKNPAWTRGDDAPNGGPDALPSSGVYSAATSLRLQTPLDS